MASDKVEKKRKRDSERHDRPSKKPAIEAHNLPRLTASVLKDDNEFAPVLGVYCVLAFPYPQTIEQPSPLQVPHIKKNLKLIISTIQSAHLACNSPRKYTVSNHIPNHRATLVPPPHQHNHHHHQIETKASSPLNCFSSHLNTPNSIS